MMKWPWRKPKNGTVKSHQAVLDASAALQQVNSRDPEIHAVSQVLKDIRERNHFADQLQTILGGR